MKRQLEKVGLIVTVAFTTGGLLAVGGCKDKDYDAAMAPEKPVKMKVWPSGHGPTMGAAQAAGGGGPVPKSSPAADGGK